MHSSYDRDDYLEIRLKNVKAGRNHNFVKFNASTVGHFGSTYDIESIMQYFAYAFSKNNLPTIVPKVCYTF